MLTGASTPAYDADMAEDVTDATAGLDNSSIIGRLLDEISWEGNAKKYRGGGRGKENVLTAEVFYPLNILPRARFLGQVIAGARGAASARQRVIAEIEHAEVSVLPGDIPLGKPTSPGRSVSASRPATATTLTSDPSARSPASSRGCWPDGRHDGVASSPARPSWPPPRDASHRGSIVGSPSAPAPGPGRPPALPTGSASTPRWHRAWRFSRDRWRWPESPAGPDRGGQHDDQDQPTGQHAHDRTKDQRRQRQPSAERRDGAPAPPNPSNRAR